LLLDAADTGPIPDVEPIADHEQLYRRIPLGWYQPGKTKIIPHRAFRPRPDDHDGISVNRAKLVTIDAAAIMPHSGKKAHLCRVNVEDVHQLGMTVIPKPLSGNLAHAVIPEMNSRDLNDPPKQHRIEEWAIALRNKAVLVYEAG
jgi:hypothetical protein